MRIEEAEGRSNPVFKILLLHHETALRPRQTMSPYQKWVPNVYEIWKRGALQPAYNVRLQVSAPVILGADASEIGLECAKYVIVQHYLNLQSENRANIVTRWEDAGNLYRCFSCVISYHILWSVIASIGSFKTRLKHPILW